MKKLLFFGFILITLSGYSQIVKIDSISIVKPGSAAAVLTPALLNNLEPFKDKEDAVIYFYRLGSMVGAAVKWEIKVDNEDAWKLGQKEYMAIHLNGAEKSHYVTYPDMRYNYTNIKPGTYYFVRLKGFDMKTGYLSNEIFDEIKSCKAIKSAKN